MKRRTYILALCLAFSGIAHAAFPLALLPGITLVFESGAMAVGYATAIALVGSVAAWLYLSPSEPSGSQAPTAKLEVRLSESEAGNISRPASVTYEDNGPGERAMYPAQTVTMSRSFTNTAQYNSHVDQIQSSYRCIVGSGCTQVIVSTGGLWAELSWAYQASDRYLRVMTSSDGEYKIDPHDVASRDGVSSASFAVCPSGYEYRGGNTCEIEDLYSHWYLPSDGICSYTTDSNGRFIIEPTAYDFYRTNRIIDPDCYDKPTKIDKLEYQVNENQKITLEAVNSNAIKVTDEKKNSDNSVDKSEYIIQKSGNDKKLTGGAYNNAFDNSSPGTGTGGDNNGEGSAVCGGAGLPPCEVDDSGFSGKGNFEATQGDNEMKAHTDAIGGVDGLDIGFSFLPSLLPGTPVACRAIPVHFTFGGYLPSLTVSNEINICSHLDVVRDIFAYLFGLGAVIYIWRRFSHANDGG